jgi:hypothetical protein
MQSAFPIVVFGAVGLSVVMSIVFLLSKGSMYDEIGSGGFPGEGERSGGGSPFGHSGPEYDSIAMNPESQRAERSTSTPSSPSCSPPSRPPPVTTRESSRRSCSWWSRATNGANAKGSNR